LEAKIATSSERALPSIEQGDPHRQVLRHAVERHAGEQRQADHAATCPLALLAPLQPAVDDDEGGGAGEEGDPGPSGAAALEATTAKRIASPMAPLSPSHSPREER
jgi:hypothetical protein